MGGLVHVALVWFWGWAGEREVVFLFLVLLGWSLDLTKKLDYCAYEV